MKNTEKLMLIFSQIDDPRSHINKLHDLVDILLIGLISVICGAETWEQMYSFAKSKEDFLKKFLILSNGIPSKHTINRVFSSIDHNEFEKCFIEWVNSMADLNKGQVISIDGKTVRGAKEYGQKSPIHLVSAWAEENNLVLGQIKTNEKSNEITAIPKLLDLLDIEGNTITIDAMGTQIDIANKIIDNKADYILAVKGNQEQLLEDVKDELRFSKNKKVNINDDLGHGRIETRVCTVVNDFQFIDENTKWTGIKSVVKIESIREFKNSDKPTEKATRYYISSLNTTAEDFQTKIRSHWSVENKLHWCLDVAFSEDCSRKRAGNASQNYAILLKVALNLLKNETSKKLSIKSKRLQSAWDNQYLAKVLAIKV